MLAVYVMITRAGWDCRARVFRIGEPHSCSHTQKAAAAQQKRPAPKKGGIQPFDKVITKDAKSDEGLFTVHSLDDKFYYEIPDSLFDREMLMVTRIAKTASGLGFGGGKQNEPQQLRHHRGRHRRHRGHHRGGQQQRHHHNTE